MSVPLVFHSGFDFYTDALTEWDAVIGTGQHKVEAPGRFGYAQRLNMTTDASGYGQTALIKYFAAGPYAHVVLGTGVRVAGPSFNPTGPYPVFLFQNSQGIPFAAISLDALGRIDIIVDQGGQFSAASFTNGHVVASSSPLAYSNDTWFYLEVDWTCGGTVIVRVNGAEVVRATGVTGLSPSIYGFGLCGFAYQPPFLYDDVYALGEISATGTPGDSFLGDVKVVALTPSSDGHRTEWTTVGNAAGITTHFTTVSEVPPDGDLTYISSSTPGQADFFHVPNPNTITPIGSIIGISVYALADKDDSPARFVSCGISDGVNDDFDAGTALGSVYKYVERVFPSNPLTSQPWLLTDFATLQIGVKLVS